jgi:hypothetical protein
MLIDKKLKTGVDGVWSSGDDEFVNYFYSRIAEAVIQLQGFPLETRQVWLVFNRHAGFQRAIFEKNYLRKPREWFESASEQIKEAKILAKQPTDWFRDIYEIVLATLDTWQLKDVIIYKTKELVP